VWAISIELKQRTGELFRLEQARNAQGAILRGWANRKIRLKVEEVLDRHRQGRELRATVPISTATDKPATRKLPELASIQKPVYRKMTSSGFALAKNACYRRLPSVIF
jgi:hypothetical protein